VAAHLFFVVVFVSSACSFGFIKFRTPDACQASILGMNGEILNGSRVRVDRARVARPPWQRRPWGERRPYPPRDDGALPSPPWLWR
jgi:RNA recognition motif-containing protein